MQRPPLKSRVAYALHQRQAPAHHCPQEVCMAEAAAEEKALPVPVGMPMKMVLIIVGGTLVVALGGAFAMFKMMAGPSDKPAVEDAADKPAAHGEAEAKGGGHGGAPETGAIADLDPFIVNL